jgi:hypothetical protein
MIVLSFDLDRKGRLAMHRASEDGTLATRRELGG